MFKQLKRVNESVADLQIVWKSTEASFPWKMEEMGVEGIEFTVDITCYIRSCGPEQGSKALKLQTLTHLLNFTTQCIPM